jgi:hypothetical protein
VAIYTAVFNGVNVTTSQDLFEIASPADAITIIHALELSQSSEIGDTQEEMLNIVFRRGNTTSATATTVTTQPIETGSSSYGGVVKANSTVKATGGTAVTLRADNWNVRMPYLWLPTPEMRPILGPMVAATPNARINIELVTVPTDAITMSGTLWFEELGG